MTVMVEHGCDVNLESSRELESSGTNSRVDAVATAGMNMNTW